jgi:5'-nucleotidase
MNFTNSCSGLPNFEGNSLNSEVVNINLLQLNDTYEINSLEGGVRGGFAGIATLKKALCQLNFNTYTMFCGDCLSPSALGNAKINGIPLAGQQIVAVMNSLGVNYATFGNHEFDIVENLFFQTLKEFCFTWFSGNVSDRNGQPFENVPRFIILNVKNNYETIVKIGLIGVTTDINKSNYVTYTDPINTANQQAKFLRDKVDILIAMTHLPIEDDCKLASLTPEIDLILGGHDHKAAKKQIKNYAPIFKSDVNSRSVYVHQLIYNTIKKSLEIKSYLIPITEEIPENFNTKEVVKKWLELGYYTFKTNGFNPEYKIATFAIFLNGLESTIRKQPTILTKLIAKSMIQETGNADLALFNSGVIRIIPFEGEQILLLEITGNLLKKVLRQGETNKGTGSYLQTYNVIWNPGSKTWLINRENLDPEKRYKVAVNTFLVSGKEKGLDFFKVDHPELKIISQKRDMRFALIEQLARLQPLSKNPDSVLVIEKLAKVLLDECH